MTDESAVSAQPVAPAAPKKRGPKPRAVIEAEMRERIEAEVREKVEAETRAKVEAEVAERERQEAEARALAAEDHPLPAKAIDGDPTAEGAVIINFVEDGFTKLGRVWFRGEHLTLNPGTPQWEDAMDAPTGKVFALLTEEEQIARWGKRYWRPGIWKGLRLDQINDPELTMEEREILRKAQADFDKKYGAVAGKY